MVAFATQHRLAALIVAVGIRQMAQRLPMIRADALQLKQDTW